MGNAQIISVFPGCKKEECIDKYKGTSTTMLDMRLDDNNGITDYINCIKNKMDKSDIILVSSCKLVRDSLKENNIKYILVIPSSLKKDECFDEYYGKDSDEKYANCLNDYLCIITNDTYKEECIQIIKLKSDETLYDLINYGYCSRFVANNLNECFNCPLECNHCNYRKTIINKEV